MNLRLTFTLGNTSPTLFTNSVWALLKTGHYLLPGGEGRRILGGSLFWGNNVDKCRPCLCTLQL